MAVKRYTANADNTITQAYESNLVTRGTGSNMGRADILEVFHIYGQESSGSQELSRAILDFPISTISSDRTAATIPASGSVSFYLRMFNAPHASTTPRNVTFTVMPLSKSWQEGYGLDMESYSDLTYNGSGSNWMNAGSGSAWALPGGDFVDANMNEGVYDIAMENGTGDIDLNITALVEDWIKGSSAGGVDNYGICLRLTASQESGSVTQYTKKFFARTSQYFFKRPLIEARWDSSTLDDRGNFYFSSALAPAADNLNRIYLYNMIRGQLKNIPDLTNEVIYVSLYSGTLANTVPSGGAEQALSVGGDVASAADLNATGGIVSTGIYTASIAFTGSTALTRVFDIWHNDGGTQFHTGAINPKTFDSSNYNWNPTIIANVTNLRSIYYPNEKDTRFRLYTREKGWYPNIYTKAVSTIENYTIPQVYYSLVRTSDQYSIISYGTGSVKYTKLSYDVTGSYFDLDISILEAGHSYTLRFLYYLNGMYMESLEEFKFRVQK